jgi:RNA polymerase subunit RPABC4/transcription elongation factor Spt4
MDFKIATYALLMVRYRSADDAIAFVTQPEFGLYRHEFIGY